MNVEYVHSSGHSPVSQIATHILCIRSSTDSPPSLNNSAGTSSGPVDFRLAVCRMARATSERSGGGSRSWYTQPRPFPSWSLYRSSQYSFHRSAICGASVRLVPFLDLMHSNLGWNFLVIDLTVWKIFLVFPRCWAVSNSSHMSSNCFCLSFRSLRCASAFRTRYLLMSWFLTSLFSFITEKVSAHIHVFFLGGLC